MLVDTHAHLEAIDNLERVLDDAREEGVDKIITIGTSIASSMKAIEIANPPSHEASEGQGNIPQIYATVGIHPRDGKEEVEKPSLSRCIDTLKQIAKSSSKVVGIGECGLDYYLAGNTRHVTSDTERKFQRELFEEQIKLAQELKLPLVIHCRNGWGEIFKIISNFKFQISNSPGVFHSFTGDWQAARKALGLGFYISFSGIVTFKNAPEIQEVVKKAPLARIVLETDSPFLAPEPLRSIQNEPKNVKITAQFVADLRGEPFAKIAEVTTRNARRLFGI